MRCRAGKGVDEVGERCRSEKEGARNFSRCNVRSCGACGVRASPTASAIDRRDSSESGRDEEMRRGRGTGTEATRWRVAGRGGGTARRR